MLIETLETKSGFTAKQIRAIAASSQSQYTVYQKKKRSGGMRTICKVGAELKLMQKLLNREVFLQYPVSKYSTAYEKGNSIIKNALIHRKAKHILRLDIKDFFQSINYRHIFDLLKDKYELKEIELIWNMVRYKDGLCVGAASSPFLANRIMYGFDCAAAKLLPGLKYTRYADDLIFSSRKYIDKSVINDITALLKEYKLTLNKDKALFMFKGGRMKVTGIILSKKKLSLGLKYRKRLKQDIYNLMTKGEGNRAVIDGKISYAQSVEPKFVKQLKKKYSAYFK